MRVTYAKLVNLGNYGNERFELTEDILPVETYQQAFDRVRAIVEDVAERTRLARVEARRRQREAEASEIPF